jgi:drug/metabolite transporter (DMT)-like permease
LLWGEVLPLTSWIAIALIVASGVISSQATVKR